MSMRIALALVAAIPLAATAQSNRIDSFHVQGNVWMLTGAGSNVAVQIEQPILVGQHQGYGLDPLRGVFGSPGIFRQERGFAVADIVATVPHVVRARAVLAPGR